MRRALCVRPVFSGIIFEGVVILRVPVGRSWPWRGIEPASLPHYTGARHQMSYTACSGALVSARCALPCPERQGCRYKHVGLCSCHRDPVDPARSGACAAGDSNPGNREGSHRSALRTHSLGPVACAGVLACSPGLASVRGSYLFWVQKKELPVWVAPVNSDTSAGVIPD